MAIEELQVSKVREKKTDYPAKDKATEQATVTKQIKCEGQMKPADQEDTITDRYQRLLAEHNVPDGEEYLHKREQLYLMVGQELSDPFIARVIGYPSQTIDRLRMIAFVTGEEFLQERITQDKPEEKLMRSWIDDFMKMEKGSFAEIVGELAVEKSLDIMGRHMVRQQEIAGEQINRLTEYLHRMNEMMQERSEKGIHALREDNQKERERAQKQIDLLSEENFRLSMKIEDAQEEQKKAAEEKKRSLACQDAGRESITGYPTQNEGLFARHRRMKEHRKREAFISATLGNNDFSAAQLTVVRRVVEEDFTLPQLQKICDPKVKPENMELLEAYYLRRQIRG